MAQSYNKRQLELARQERAARKQQRRVERAALQAQAVDPVVDESTTLDALTRLHEAFEAGKIDFDEFELTKLNLIAQLRVD